MKEKFVWAIPVALFLTAGVAGAATKEFINNTRIIEDSLWAVAFVFMGLFAYTAMKSMQSSKALHNAYLVLAWSAIFGIAWKVVGVFMRTTGIKDPKWFFETTREGLEMISSYLFLIAFVILLLKLRK